MGIIYLSPRTGSVRGFQVGNPNCGNRTLFHGDNLTFMRTMNLESVDLIATDPPFNKGKDFHPTPDSLAAGAKFQDRWSWEKDVHEEWVDQIKDDYPYVMHVIQGSRSSYGDDMGASLLSTLEKGTGRRSTCSYNAGTPRQSPRTRSEYRVRRLGGIMNRRRKTIKLNIRHGNRVETIRFDRYLGFQDVIVHCKYELFKGVDRSRRNELYKLVRERDGHVFDYPEILDETDLEEYEVLELVEHPKGH